MPLESLHLNEVFAPGLTSEVRIQNSEVRIAAPDFWLLNVSPKAN